MDVSIKFDQPEATYTNGDTVEGSVVLYCKSTITLSKVTVTLSGKSTSGLSGTSGLLLHRRNRESHRFVHETQDITPYTDNLKSAKQEPVKLSFGYHSFPFRLNIPWLAECKVCPAGGSRELPPSMCNLVKDADISYKVDTSVTVRNILKENISRSVKIYVWPLDERPLSVSRMAPDSFPCTSKISASISGVTHRPGSTQQTDDLILIPSVADPAQISVESRFPQDFALTCGRDVAMSLNVKKCDKYLGTLSLQSFQMLLVGYTNISGQPAAQGQTEFWMIQSLSNIDYKISDAYDAVGSGKYISEEMWEGKPLPMSVIPSFKSCNLERRYELEILMGFQCEAPRGRVKFVQLCVPVKVYSGIIPGQCTNAKNDPNSQAGSFDLSFQADDVRSHSRNYRREDSITRPVSHISRHSVPASPPPTYSQATLTSMNNGLRREEIMAERKW
ncbi:hypothetical protein K505DRAFT_337269 [Melanomma pulvis-pyrius CBS 109.77]|uniref:Arrestin-like N-terminal domain-containing protein n=1 Tax=Melanomma pulvis-pyrius CBS 109.77 TaxID=1314802 RepID=A0A6A6XBX4_9PLEO|nr:hypothetical protein K505DRAFT_337269 [Melanomma pulvis-pyrius CBS 109.77]